jgi:YegS/Rv2252/BmrU family lipid kinase
MAGSDQHWYAIINPAAGNGRSYQRWDILRQALEEKQIRFTETISKYRGHVAELAGAAILDGFTHFLSIGGDGSHHELINGLLNHKSDQRAIPVVAILSAGSGNDWARTHNISADIADCLEAIEAGKTISHPVGKINFTRAGVVMERYFINVAGMGLDGRVVETFPESFKRIPFLPGYLLAGLRQLLVYHAQEVQIESVDTNFKGYCLTINAGIGNYSGGGMQFVPHGNPLRSDLAITYVERMPKWRLFANIYRLYTGSLLSHPKATGFHCTELKVSGENIPLEADGEFLGYTPISISFLPDAFRLVVPSDR